MGFKCRCSSWLQLLGELDWVQWCVLGSLLLHHCDLPPAPVQLKAGSGVYWDGEHGYSMQVVARSLPALGLGSAQGLRFSWVGAVICTLVTACVVVGGQALVPGPAVLCDVEHSPVVGLSPCNLTVSCAALLLLKILLVRGCSPLKGRGWKSTALKVWV